MHRTVARNGLEDGKSRRMRADAVANLGEL
jgi:hypothetical protein